MTFWNDKIGWDKIPRCECSKSIVQVSRLGSYVQTIRNIITDLNFLPNQKKKKNHQSRCFMIIPESCRFAGTWYKGGLKFFFVFRLILAQFPCSLWGFIGLCSRLLIFITQYMLLCFHVGHVWIWLLLLLAYDHPTTPLP